MLNWLWTIVTSGLTTWFSGLVRKLFSPSEGQLEVENADDEQELKAIHTAKIIQTGVDNDSNESVLSQLRQFNRNDNNPPNTL